MSFEDLYANIRKILVANMRRLLLLLCSILIAAHLSPQSVHSSPLPSDTDIEAFIELESLLAQSSAGISKMQQVLHDSELLLVADKAECSRVAEIRGHFVELTRRLLKMHQLAVSGNQEQLAQLSKDFGTEVSTIERKLSIELANLNKFIATLFDRVARQRAGESTPADTQSSSPSWVHELFGWLGL